MDRLKLSAEQMEQMLVSLTKENALRILAEGITKRGESRYEANFCLVPHGFFDDFTSFTAVSDYLFENYKFTHFDLKWEEPLKTVKVTLHKGDSFGACGKFTGSEEHIVSIEREENHE